MTLPENLLRPTPPRPQGYEATARSDRLSTDMDTSRSSGEAPRTGNGPVRSDPVYVAKARLFRTLGHPVRIRILELLRDGERSVGDLQAELRLDSSGTSQHLAALRQQDLLDSRREGTSVYYRLRDPRVAELLAVAKRILAAALTDSQTPLSHMADEAPENLPRA